MMKSILRVSLCATLLTLLAACAGVSSTKGGGASNQEEALMERAIDRWDLLIASKAGEAWEYLSPGYRATHPQNIYAQEMSQRPVRWSRVEPFVPMADSTAKPVECDDAGLSCNVRLQVHFKIRSHLTSVGLLDSSSVVNESWIKLKGQWYLVPKDVAQ